jgi:hypothetical protein
MAGHSDRRMRCAQPGGVPVASSAPPTVPMVEEPPVIPKPDLMPSEKPNLTPVAARQRGRPIGRTCDVAMPSMPEATPDTPDRPNRDCRRRTEVAPTAVAPSSAARLHCKPRSHRASAELRAAADEAGCDARDEDAEPDQ